jgi:hypothetical protein
MEQIQRIATGLVVIAWLIGTGLAGSARADETWTLAESPIRITVDTTIAPGVTVTVEPGVAVELVQGARLFVEGSLVGAGTPSQPITFSGGAESFTYIQVPGSLVLSHAVMDVQVRPAMQGSLQFTGTTFDANSGMMNLGAGHFLSLDGCLFNGSFLWVGGGTILLKDTSFLNDFVQIGNSVLRMQNVSSSGSPSYGVSLHSFDQPVYVNDLSVSNAGGPGIDIVAGNFFFGDNVQLLGNEYPVQLGGAGILPGSTLPAGGNLNNEIKVEFASNGVWSMVWADPGIPYVMTGGQYHTGTLEILPGVTVLLEPNFTVWDDDSVVDARGLPGNPVRFLPLIPGQTWQGLQYFHRFENCIIEGGQAGARFHSGTYPGNIDNCIIRNNDFGMQNDARVRKTRFIDNVVGAWGNDFPQGLESSTNSNSFVGNGLAVDYVDHSIDARFNWFGDPSGPSSPANPGGSGDAVDSGVNVMPFLTAEPDFNDNPPVLRLLASPRRENAGMSYSSFIDPGTTVIVSWNVQDELAVTGHRVEFFNGWENAWSVVAELPGDQRSFEWVVPDVGFVNNSSSHRLRVIAIDAAGQEGWDEHDYFIPTGVEPGTLSVTGMPPGPFLPGQSIGPLCWEAVGTDPYDMVDVELSYDGDQRHIPLGSGFADGCLVLSPSAPFISSDTARIRVNTQGGQNRVNYFFSEYFTIRPDSRLGDTAPTVTLGAPLGGETFAGGGIVPIHWTATDDEGVRSIDIQISTDGGRTWHFIAEDLPATATSFDWQLPPSAGLPDVRARVMVSDLHFQTSTAGGEVSFSVTPGSGGSSCTQAPDDVSGLSVAADKIRLQWSGQLSIETYDVARGVLNGLAVGLPAECIGVSTQPLHDDLDGPPSPGTAYYYIIRATNACGDSSWGQGVRARSVACP